MKDVRGTEIKEGDKLACVHQTRRAEIVVGKVLRVSDKSATVEIEVCTPGYRYGRELAVGDIKKVQSSTLALVL